MIIGYARVSRKEQAENGNAFKNQKERLLKANIDKLLSDIGSRTDDNRKDFLKLKQLIEQGVVSKIVVTRVDRLSGNLMTLLELAELCDRLNCQISPLDEIVDITTAMGLLQYSMTGAISAYNVRLIRQKIRQGYQARQNRKAANPRPPYGYLVIKEKYVLNPKTIDICQDMIYIYIKERSLSKATKIIFTKYEKKWSPAGFRNWLLNPVLRGHTPYKTEQNRTRRLDTIEEIIYNTHPDQILLSNQQYEMVKDIINYNKTHWGKNSQATTWVNPFVGLLKCWGCGQTVDIIHKKRKSGKIVRYTNCRTRNNRFLGLTCEQKGVCYIETIEKALTQALINKAISIANLASEFEDIPESPTILNLRSQINQLKSIPNANPAITAAIEELERQLVQAQSEGDIFEDNQQQLKKDLVKVFQDPVLWNTVLKHELSPHELRSLYARFVEKIVVKGKEVVEVQLTI
ncbi:MAG: recombinase family protein [Crocosphaera sp.]|nr:recombinase family protein [Crocosphaera sp.]